MVEDMFMEHFLEFDRLLIKNEIWKLARNQKISALIGESLCKTNHRKDKLLNKHQEVA